MVFRSIFKNWREFHFQDFQTYFAAQDRKPIWQQVREAGSLFWLYRHVPTQYLKSGLYQLNAHDDIHSHVPPRMIWRLQAGLNPPEARIFARDKQRFRVKMEEAGVPFVREVLIVDREGVIHDADGVVLDIDSAISRLQNGDFFVKPVDGIKGRNARLFGPHDDAEDFLTSARNVIVQPRIRQHGLLGKLYPHSVNTVRIDTLCDGENWTHNAAVLKLGQGGGIVDNRSAIGLVIGVDLETGALHPPARAKTPRGIATYYQHPDTGTTFSGVVLPHWKLLRETVMHAAKVMLPLKSLGWDVAITEDGVLLVEANDNWGVNILQSGYGGLANTSIGQMALRGRRCT